MFMLYESVAWPRQRERERETKTAGKTELYVKETNAPRQHTYIRTPTDVCIYLYIAYKIVNVILFTCIACGQSVLPHGHKLHSAQSNPGTTTTTRRTSLPASIPGQNQLGMSEHTHTHRLRD